MPGLLKRLLREIRLFLKGIEQALLENSVQILEAEYLEYENLFLTVLLGSLVGIRTVPSLLALELLESVKDEIRILLSRGYRGEDVFADIASLLGVV